MICPFVLLEYSVILCAKKGGFTAAGQTSQIINQNHFVSRSCIPLKVLLKGRKTPPDFVQSYSVMSEQLVNYRSCF